MKEIKAFIHRNRAADVVRILVDAGFNRLSIVEVKSTIPAMSKQEQAYSVELGRRVVTESKLEMICEDGRVDEAVRLIRKNACTGQQLAGWICLSEIAECIPIDDTEE